MTEQQNKKQNKEIKNPIETLQIAIEDIAIQKAKKQEIKFGNPVFQELTDEADSSSTKYGIFELNGETFEYDVNKKILIVKKILNGVFDKIQKIKDFPNNKTLNYGDAIMQINIKTENGILTAPFELNYKAKSSAKDFKEALNKASNHLVFDGSDKTLTAIRTLLNEKCIDTIYRLPNSGKIKFQKYNGRLYQNAYCDENGICVADSNNVIELFDKEKVMLNSTLGNQLPLLDLKLKDVNSKQIFANLIKSIDNAFCGNIAPFLAIGLGIMGLYLDDIWQDTCGFPIGYLYGASKQGKSTLTTIISYIYGFDYKFLAMGHSTTKSIDRKTNLYNNSILFADDISSLALMRESFENLIVQLYECKNREKLKNGNEFNILPICSTIMMTSNYLPVHKDKMLNRMLPLYFERNMYDSKLMEEYYDNPTYLSRIVPDFLSENSWEKVKTKLELFENWLVNTTGVCKSRETHNVAIAFTGLKLIEEFAEIKLENIETKVIEYFNWYIEQFKTIEEPIDSFLNHLVGLLNDRLIKVKQDIKLEYDDKGQVQLILRTQQCLDKFNSFIGKIYPEKFINAREFMISVKNSPYYIETKNARFECSSKRIPPIAKSVFLNIDEHLLFEDITNAFANQVANAISHTAIQVASADTLREE